MASPTARFKTEYTENTYAPFREQLINEGRMKPSDDQKHLVFIEDVAFKSPSAASGVILNRNDNGRRSWRVKETGQSLADWQDAQVPIDEGDEDLSTE